MKRGSSKDPGKSYIDPYNSSVYGKSKLEPVLVDLIDSSVINRLRGIQQHGPDAWVWEHANITRFEHSVGVMILLKKFGAPLQEQVVGLLHDVSHGAFSHAIDFVYDNQLVGDFADKMVADVIGKSNVPEILVRYGFTLKGMFEMDLYQLLERSAPDLCADRIDYFFRDSYRYGLASMEDIHFMLAFLTVANNEFVFSNTKAAFMFGSKYLEAAVKIFGSKESIFFYTMIAEAIKLGMENEILTKDDLFVLNDLDVKNILVSSGNKDIKQKLSLISSKTRLEIDEENPDYHLRVKTRLVDPKVVVNDGAVRLSDINSSYKLMLEESRKKQEMGYKVKVHF